MIIYICGEEPLLIRERFDKKVKEIEGPKLKFDLGGKDSDLEKLRNAFFGGGLFGRPVIVCANPSNTKDGKEIVKFLEKNPDQPAIFYEYRSPIPKHILVKFLKQNSEFTNFSKLKYFEKKRFVQDRIAQFSGRATDEQVQKILLISDANLEVADLIAQKLALYYTGQKMWQIEDKVFDGLVGKDIFGSIFDLIENIAFGNQAKSLAILEKLLANRESEFYILVMVASQFRKILCAKSMLKRSIPMSKVARELSIPNFNQKKIYALAKKLSFEELRSIFSQLLRYEEDVKSGRVDAATNLELLVLSIT